METMGKVNPIDVRVNLEGNEADRRWYKATGLTPIVVLTARVRLLEEGDGTDPLGFFDGGPPLMTDDRTKFVGVSHDGVVELASKINVLEFNELTRILDVARARILAAE
jgi:hypothetical protein